MTRLPDESISFQNTVGDSGVENLYVYGKLTYDFQGDDITVKSIISSTLSMPSNISSAAAPIFKKAVKFFSPPLHLSIVHAHCF